jgi:T5SS/PEP-CTERM-associated repeat protein
MTLSRISARFSCVGLAWAATFGAASLASAQGTPRNVPWQGANNGNWTTITNWNNGTFGQPLAEFGETALIDNGTTVVVNTAVNDSVMPPPASGGQRSTTGGVILGNTANMNGTLSIQSGGNLNVQFFEYLNSQSQLIVAPGTIEAGVVANSTGTLTIATGGAATVGRGVTIGRAGTGTLNMNGGTFNPESIYLGRAASGVGTATVANGATVTVTNNAQIGQLGRGTLTVNGGGTFTAGRLNSGGVGGANTSAIIAGDASGLTATVTSNGPSTLLRRTQIVGPNVNFTVNDTLSLPVTHELYADIRAATHSPLKATSTASVAGILRPTFTGVTPTLGNTWNLVTATSIAGTFDSIDASAAPALPAGQGYVTRKVAGGNGQQLQLAVEQLLTLQVNRQTGALAIRNTGSSAAADVAIDGYSIFSSNNGLAGANWNSLQDQAVAGWQEAPATTGSLSELKSTAGTTNFANGSTRALGTPYTPMYTEFMAESDDVSFQYATPTGLRTGLVEYVGTKVQNNLVVTIDAATGAAVLKNDSPFNVSIEGYSILSASGALRPANGQWSSLADQGVPNAVEAAPTANALSELITSGSLAVAANSTRNLGTLFNPAGMQDLSFEFLLLDAPDSVEGVVVFAGGGGGHPADFDNNGTVNAADLTVWRNAFGTNANGDADNDGDSDGNDFLIWQRSLGQSGASGATAAVPEPSALLLSALAALAIGRRPKRRRQEPKVESPQPERSATMIDSGVRHGAKAWAVVLLACFAAAAGRPARAADILYVGGDPGLARDVEFVQILKNLGHTVVNEGSYQTNGFFNAPPTPAELTGVDMILFGRTANSGNYDDGAEPAQWNTLNIPIMILNSAMVRGGDTTTPANNRWGWIGATAVVSGSPTPTNFDAYTNPTHPFVTGRTTNVYPPNQTMDYINSLTIPAGATMVATLTIPEPAGPVQTPGIVDIPTGTTLFADAAGTVSVTANRRVFFQLHEYPDETDVFAITNNGAQILDQIINILGGTASSPVGDVDGNGTVNIADFNIIRTNFQTSVTSRTLGDLSGDGFVDLEDFRLWKDNAALATGATAAVPEPAGLALGLCGMIALGAVRARRRQPTAACTACDAVTSTGKEASRELDSRGDFFRRKLLMLTAAFAALAIASRAGAANIAWVSFHAGDNTPSQGAIDHGFTMAPDIGYTDLLTAAGHTVTRFQVVNDINANATLLGQLNAPDIDLVIASRSVDSGFFQTADEALAWNNTVNKPMMLMSGYIVRNSRLGFMADETIPDTNAPVKLLAAQPAHPIFQGIALDGSNAMVEDYSTAPVVINNSVLMNVTQRGISVNSLATPIDANGAGGTLLATVAPGGSQAGNLVIAEWAPGTSITKDTGPVTVGNTRMIFLSGSREHAAAAPITTSSQVAGILDLAPAGQNLFRNAVAYLTEGVPTPGDVDGDDDVDMTDFAAIQNRFQQSATMRSQGDLNADGIVDFKDFRQWKANFPTPGAPVAGAVPEPATAGLALVAALALSGVCRKRA